MTLAILADEPAIGVPQHVDVQELTGPDPFRACSANHQVGTDPARFDGEPVGHGRIAQWIERRSGRVLTPHDQIDSALGKTLCQLEMRQVDPLVFVLTTGTGTRRVSLDDGDPKLIAVGARCEQATGNGE